jgi:hypothetical protein
MIASKHINFLVRVGWHFGRPKADCDASPIGEQGL